MNNFLNILLKLIEYADAHDGIVAVIGIAVTLYIFYREITNNFYTLEKENFNELFQQSYKDIPAKIRQLENSSQSEWNSNFEELLNALRKVLDAANYFKYTMPYLYELLEIYIGEIEDLSRHENWRIYRCSEKQVNLITKKTCKIIRAINNASKGRITNIKIRRSWIVRKIKALIIRLFVDRPYDRIASHVVKASYQEAIIFKNTMGEAYSHEDLMVLKWGQLQISSKSGVAIVRVIPIKTTGVIRFGYVGSIRMGKRIGRINLKTLRDRGVKVLTKRQIKLTWKDKWAHKVVVLWENENDENHLFYDVVKFRRDMD